MYYLIAGIQSWPWDPFWILSRRLQMRQPILKVSDLSYRWARKQQTLVSLSLSLSLGSLLLQFYIWLRATGSCSGLDWSHFSHFRSHTWNRSLPHQDCDPSQSNGSQDENPIKVSFLDILSPFFLHGLITAISFNYKMKISASGRHDQHLMKIRKQQKSFTLAKFSL